MILLVSGAASHIIVRMDIFLNIQSCVRCGDDPLNRRADGSRTRLDLPQWTHVSHSRP